MADWVVGTIGVSQLLLGIWLGWQYKAVHERRKWRRVFKTAMTYQPLALTEPCCCGVRGCDGTGPWPVDEIETPKENR